nr:UPF0348 protein CPR_1697 [Moritella viscosa]SHO14661.1 UPF0348 protein CPR_1697 [Moritella viscosa]SHO18825.1 UPF0348 protein CPR_1697 [Moritella viscosa]
MFNRPHIAEFIPELKTLFQTLSFNLFAFAEKIYATWYNVVANIGGVCG